MKVAIVGAGFGGIATAVKLARAGLRDFTVFEQSAGPGGTWWTNRFPGAEVDVESDLYCFSFMPYRWTRTHARQPELSRYAEDVIDHFAIRDRFRFGKRVIRVVWESGGYRLELEDGEQHRARVVVSAVGLFNVPKLPDCPGLDEFRGITFHTARWESQHDLVGKRIAVVGTGSTSAQLIPELAKIAERVYVFQREPGWVKPKPARDFTATELARLDRRPWLRRIRRWKLIVTGNSQYKRFALGSKENLRAQAASLEYIERAIRDPALRAAVTPQYPWGCKRVVIASTYYEALNRPNVTLIPHSVVRATPTGVIDKNGKARDVDVIILSTGFATANYLASLDVIGPSGSLRQMWSRDPRAVLGISVPGIPNFFILYGPNTNGAGSILQGLELQADVVVRTVRRMGRRGKAVLDTRGVALDLWVRYIDRRNRKLQGAGYAGCHNYYFAPSGRNVTQFPGSHIEYRFLTRVLPRLSYTTRT